ncbi:MAG TPA: DUF1330 domain-containing protein [Puia sp.]|nr:DUF1330 domain-containing protein [Puia sp.]
MSAYVIVEVTIHDHSEYEKYKKLTPAAIAAFNGRFLVRGGETISLEGDWKPERIVVLEFPSVEKANEWWLSELYTEAKLIRQRAAYTKMILVQGA